MRLYGFSTSIISPVDPRMLRMVGPLFEHL